MGPISCLVIGILEETHTGLKQLEGEQMMTQFSLLGELSL